MKRGSLLLILILVAAGAGWAQSDCYLILNSTTQDTVNYHVADTLENPLLVTSGSFDLELVIELDSLSGIDLLEVEVGRTAGAADVVDHIFTYDDTAPGGSYTYLRNGDIIRLGLGTHTDVMEHHLEVVFKDNSGNIIETITYSSL